MESYLKYLLSFYVTTEVLYPDSTKLSKVQSNHIV